MEKYTKKSPRVKKLSIKKIYQDFMSREQDRTLDQKNKDFEKMMRTSKTKLDKMRSLSKKVQPSPKKTTVAQKLSLYFK
jgi:hypothetical protein